jgi:hypothetical protein
MFIRKKERNEKGMNGSNDMGARVRRKGGHDRNMSMYPDQFFGNAVLAD